MPKPNRYQGNGKAYPEGTVMGRYVMRRGHWVDQDSPVARAADQRRDGKPGGWLVTAMLGLLCCFMLMALFGCSVNVVNIHNADIGVQVASTQEILKEARQ